MVRSSEELTSPVTTTVRPNTLMTHDCRTATGGAEAPALPRLEEPRGSSASAKAMADHRSLARRWSDPGRITPEPLPVRRTSRDARAVADSRESPARQRDQPDRTYSPTTGERTSAHRQSARRRGP